MESFIHHELCFTLHILNSKKKKIIWIIFLNPAFASADYSLTILQTYFMIPLISQWMLFHFIHLAYSCTWWSFWQSSHCTCFLWCSFRASIVQKRIIYFQDEGTLTKKMCEKGRISCQLLSASVYLRESTLVPRFTLLRSRFWWWSTQPLGLGVDDCNWDWPH